MAFKIIVSQCTQCGACEFECPSDAISFKGEGYVVDPKNVPSAGVSLTRNNVLRCVRCRRPASLPDRHRTKAQRMGRAVSGLIGEHEVKNSRTTNIPSSERCTQPE